jgi:hypothetical protein
MSLRSKIEFLVNVTATMVLMFMFIVFVLLCLAAIITIYLLLLSLLFWLVVSTLLIMVASLLAPKRYGDIPPAVGSTAYSCTLPFPIIHGSHINDKVQNSTFATTTGFMMCLMACIMCRSDVNLSKLRTTRRLCIC